MSRYPKRKTRDSIGLLSDYEDVLAIISRRIQQIVFKRNQNQRPFQNKKEINKIKITCYGCNKVGQIKT